MPGSPIPSLNTVSLIGTISFDARIDEADGKRSVTIGVTTQHSPVPRTHRVVIQDEFLAQSVHDRLRSGALIHVTGELDQDDAGVYVAVVNRRGSDVRVIGGGIPSEARQTQPRQAAPPASPRTAPATPPASAPQVEAVPSRQAEPEPSVGQPDAEPERGQAPVATRPVVPVVPPRPAVAPQRSSLAGLAASSVSAPEQEQDDGGESGDEGEGEAAPAQPPAATHVPAVAPMRMAPALPGAGPRPMPPRVAPSVGVRPAPAVQPRPALPTGGPRPGVPNGAARPLAPKPLGPAKDDDDIPF